MTDRRNLSPEDRYEMDREAAIEAEYQAMLDKPLRCWIEETVTMPLRSACCRPLPLALLNFGRKSVQVDLEAIIRAIAEARAETFAEQCRIDHATGNDR